jgi:DegV family protein with EDD domain
VTELNGQQIYGAFRAGALRLRSAQETLNGINVFPVPDGDTGTNMAVTITRAIEGASVSDSVSATMSSMADAALAGARGNSGVILAQFLAGFRESLADSASLSMERFVRAIEQAYLASHRAISNPREGTIISVIRAWSQALRREHDKAADFRELFRAAAPSLRASLEATTEQLEVLKKAGVVDAGASGFVAFIDGAHEYIEAGALPPELGLLGGGAGFAPLPSGSEESEIEAGGLDGNFEQRFCSEFFLAPPAGGRLDLEEIRQLLSPLGDSLIVAGSGARARVHIHCNRPALVMEKLARTAWVLEQKIDDMRRQYEDAHDRRSRVALVTDSSCDLPSSLFDAHRIHVLPLFLRFGEREFLDRLTLEGQDFYDLADAAPVFPTSSQPTRPSLERLYKSLLSHYDRVVAIHLSGKLSGTFEAARAAAASVDPSRISVIDSRHLSGSLGLVVLRAAEYLEARGGEAGLRPGELADALVAELPAWSRKARILVSVRTLKFMVRGGRVSPLGGVLAKVLNLKPIVSVDAEGASKLHGAAFSIRANLRRIVAMVEAQHAREPLLAWAVVHAHSPEEARLLAARLEAKLGFPPVHVSEISAVVGMNAGRGALSVVVISR